MICYTHRDNQAIGICKYCGKAVCDECAIVDNSGIACSERCHQELLAYAVMAEKSKAVYGMKSGRIPITTIFLLAAGAVFLLMGVYFASKGNRYVASLAAHGSYLPHSRRSVLYKYQENGHPIVRRAGGVALLYYVPGRNTQDLDLIMTAAGRWRGCGGAGGSVGGGVSCSNRHFVFSIII